MAQKPKDELRGQVSSLRVSLRALLSEFQKIAELQKTA